MVEQAMKVVFIATGGTIDKDYSSCAGTYNFAISEPAVRRVLEIAQPNFDYEIISVLRKDSLDITEEDRQKVYDACLAANCRRIVITHGTDTMINTAKRLSSLDDAMIVITGASKPERFNDSDAAFNVGTAVGAINLVSRGIYIAKNGRVYEWDKCRKVEETGVFVDK